MLEIPVLADEFCERPYGTRYRPPSVFCAGIVEGGKDACHGGPQ